MKCAGNFLVEFLIYFTITTFLVTLTVHWITVCNLKAVAALTHNTDSIALCAAHDCLVRDIRQVELPAGWKLREHNRYHMVIDNQDVGWELTGTRLTRFQGKHTALVADTITAFSLIFESSYVMLVLQGKVGEGQETYKHVIVPHTRVIT